MKRGIPGQSGVGGGAKKPSLRGSRLSAIPLSGIPMEWMDPMSWRLPSGKALAEFALQAGFLAPLMLSGPALKRKKIPAAPLAGAEKSAVRSQVVQSQVAGSQAGEEPDPSGTFREGGLREGTWGEGWRKGQ